MICSVDYWGAYIGPNSVWGFFKCYVLILGEDLIKTEDTK